MKATKKLIGAFVALIAALAVSVGATFAWFTTSNTAKVAQIELDVRSATGNLLIGTSEDNVSMEPVTITPKAVQLDALTLDVESGKLQKEDASNADNYNANADGESTFNAYLEFKLYFQADSELDVYLLNDDSEHKSEITGTNADNENDIIINNTGIQALITEANYGANLSSNKIETNAANAARVGFFDTAGTSTTGVWAPNESEGHGYYKNNLAADYNTFIKTGTWPDKDAGSIGTTNKAHTYDKTITAETKPDGAAGKAAEGSTTLVHLTGSEGKCTGSITVRVWLEGKDGDCLNSIFKDKITVSLFFVGLEAYSAD